MTDEATPISDFDIGDIEIGMSAHYYTILDRQRVLEFARLSGDISPLHVDEEFGRQSMFGDNLAHGMLLASHFSTLVGVFIPGKNALLSSLSTSFRRPVPVGSEVVVSASVTEILETQRIITMRLLAFLKGEICAEGTATVKVLPPHAAGRK